MMQNGFNFGRKLLLILALALFLTPSAFAQNDAEDDPGFFASILERLGIGGEESEEEELEPLINPAYVPPVIAGIALGTAGVLIFLGYQAPPPKRDPFNRRL